MLRYRRNINCLMSNQLHDLREALGILYALPESRSLDFDELELHVH